MQTSFSGALNKSSNVDYHILRRLAKLCLGMGNRFGKVFLLPGYVIANIFAYMRISSLECFPISFFRHYHFIIQTAGRLKVPAEATRWQTLPRVPCTPHNIQAR